MAYICIYCCIHNLFMHKKNMNGLSALTGIQKLEMMLKLLSGKQQFHACTAVLSLIQQIREWIGYYT